MKRRRPALPPAACTSRVEASKVISPVKTVAQRHHHLFVGLSTCLPEDGHDEQERHDCRLLTRIKSRFLGDAYKYNMFLDIIDGYSLGFKSKRLLFEEVSAVFKGNLDLMNDFHHHLNATSPPPQPSRSSLKSFAAKPLSDLLVKDQRIIDTVSYVKVPEWSPALLCSGRTELGMSVLNDQYVNVRKVRNNRPKLVRNMYLEALFRCEDEHFDEDMRTDCTLAALKALRSVKERMDRLSLHECAQFQMDVGDLSAVHLCTIQRMYDAEEGLALIDSLQRTPAVEITAVIARLEATGTDWGQQQRDMLHRWQETHEQNYHRSLDFCSAEFKQLDRQALMPKNMVAELSFAVTATRQHGLRPTSKAHNQRRGTFSAGHTTAATTIMLPAQPLQPQPVIPLAEVELECSQRLVFQDCLDILSIAIPEGTGLKEKVLDLYLNIIEPFFGLSQRAKETGACLDVCMRTADAQGQAQKASSSTTSGHAERDPEEPRELSVATPVGGSQHADVNSKVKPALCNQDMDDGTSAGRRPLASCLGPSSSSGIELSLQVPETSNVLFGDNMMFLFLRYHGYLIERLSLARKCCSQQAELSIGQVKVTLKQTLPPAAEAPATIAGNVLHSQFLTMVQKLMVGDMESDVFEDECFILLGSNSYTLVTLKQLVTELVGTLQTMVQDARTMKLWEVFRCERSRRMSEGPLVSVFDYHTVTDASAYRFEYSYGATKPQLFICETHTHTTCGNGVVLPSNVFTNDFIRCAVPHLSSSRIATHVDLHALQTTGAHARWGSSQSVLPLCAYRVAPHTSWCSVDEFIAVSNLVCGLVNLVKALDM